MGKISRSIIAFVCLGFLVVNSGCKKKQETGEPAAAAVPLSGELRVSFFSPEGQTQEPHGAETAVVIFDKPMIPLKTLEEESAPELIEFTPSVSGTFRWLNPRTLAFSPEEKFPYATEIRALVPSGVRSYEGYVLKEDRRWTFQTVRPRLLEHFPRHKQQWLDLETEVLLIFNIPMSPQKAAEFITLETVGHQTTGASVAFEIKTPSKKELEETQIDAPPETLLMLKPREKLKPDCRYRVRIRAGLPADEGGLGTENTRIIDFSTYREFAFAAFEAGEHHSPGAELEFRFTNPVAYKDFVRHIRLRPEVAIPEYYDGWDQSNDRLWLSLPLEPETGYRLRIGSGLEDRFGNRLEEDVGLEFQTGAYPARVDMTPGIGIVESHGDRRYPLYAVNSKSAGLKAGSIRRLDLIPLLKTKRLFGRKNPYVRKDFFRYEETVPLNRKRNVREIFPVDLKKFMEKNTGVVFIQVDTRAEDEWNRYLKALLLVTDLGISAKYSPENNVIWVTSLKEGKPVAGADIEIRGDDNKVKWRGRTDIQGKASTPGWKSLGIRSRSQWDKPRQWVFVRKDGDFAFASSEWGTGVYPYRLGIPYDWNPGTEEFRGCLFTERGIYRAGETVHIKGIFRKKTEGRWAVPSTGEVLCELRDPFNKIVLSKKCVLDAFGSVSLDFETDEEASLGNYRITAATGASGEKEKPEKTYGSFRLEAFRPAAFEVRLRSLEESYVFGDEYRGVVRADYLFGGAMAFQDLSWTLRLNPASFNPPGFEEYIFGNSADYWIHSDSTRSRLVFSGEGKLDKDGSRRVQTGLVPEKETDSMLATLEATVSGPGRRSVSSRIQTMVHRGEFYIGAKPQSRFLTNGEEFKLRMVTVEPSGKVDAGRKIKLTLFKREWHSVKRAGMGGRFRWITEKQDTKVEVRNVESKSRPVEEVFLPEKAGYYIVKAESRDKRKNAITTSLSFYVTGREYVPWKREDDDVIELIADREAYQPGDVARVLVKSPYEKARALVTLEREGVMESRVEEIVGSSSAIEVPVRSEHIPNVYVCVILVQGRISDAKMDREQDPGKPSFKIGYVNLGVDPEEKRLSVSIEKDKPAYSPGEKVSIRLEVTGTDGEGRLSSLSVAAVDMGVLNLIGYRTPDPFSRFYRQRPLSVQTSETRHMVVGRRVFGEKGDEPAGGLGETAKSTAPLSLSEVELRGDFKFTAYWNPSVTTDEKGNAEISFHLPDNLTTFKVMAVAQTKESEFGKAEDRFRVAKSLLMQPSLPRFLRTGDAFHGGVLIHNNSERKGRVTVDCMVTGLACLDKETVRRFPLNPGEGREVLFSFRAEKKGTAAFVFRAKMGEESDGLEISIPILLPRPTETVALYNDTVRSTVEKIKVPENADTDLSTLAFQASGTALSGLKGSVDYLKEYPYLCLEQRISSVLPFLVAGDVIFDFGLTEAAEKEIRDFVSETLKEIYRYQRGSGGFGLWPESSSVNPFNSCYAAFALHQAGRSGYKVDSRVVSRLLAYLRKLIAEKTEREGPAGRRSGTGRNRYPYGPQIWKTIDAYALYCLALFDRPEPAFAERLFAGREPLSLFGRTLLLKAFFHGEGDTDAQNTLLEELVNKLKVSPTTAHFEEDPGIGGGWIYSSNLRSTALILQAMLELKVKNPLIPAIARWLVERRNAGKWLTTQENFYSFYALNDFYRNYEDIRPDFEVKVDFAGKTLLEQAFENRKQAVRRSETSLAGQEPGSVLDLSVEKKGRGRLYYETRMTYAPVMPLSARDSGFTVYKSIADFEGRPLETIKAGDLVVVTLQIIAPQERLFAVVDDPLPAGLEAVNPRFEIESRERRRQLAEFGENRRRWWEGFNHTEMRDDRVLLFADSLAAGIHTHRYLARALTFGKFRMPGTKAEEMYAPEVFGRSREAVIEIKKEP